MLTHSIFHIIAVLAVSATAAPTQKRQAPSGVPDYVIKYAPIVYLYSGEQYFPSDISSQLTNTVPEVSYQAVVGVPSPLTLNNLNSVTSSAYLTSKVDITTNPTWLKGIKPDSTGLTSGGKTTAIIVNDKGSGNVDAFYMYFYAYNWGGTVLSIPSLNFGNHVGDWEHNMIRFSNGVPQYVWYSQHSNGEAFAYSVVEKIGDRPVTYSANGSHANYAISGTHDHTIPNFNLPGGVLEDHTDKGAEWDPTLAAYYYSFNAADSSFTAYDGSSPTNWLSWKGYWGDQQYPDSDSRQVVLFGEAKYSSGPTGPVDKQLNRTNVCPDNGETCILRTILVPKSLEELDRPEE